MLDIGPQIKRMREQKRMTGKDLALRIGLSQSQMSRLEQGQRRIDTEILARIAEALEVSPASFFVGVGVEEGISTRREKELHLSRVYAEIGKRIRHERRQRHLTAEDLARKTGQTKAYVLAVEEGRRNGLEGEFLRKACRLLAIDPFTLLETHEGIIRRLKSRVHQLDRDLAAGANRTTPDGHIVAGIPILVGDESLYPSEFDAAGRPVAAVEGYLVLPDLDGRPTFALRVQGSSMDGGQTPRFRDGDLIVFATDRAARTGEFAFVRTIEDRTDFRWLFHDENAIRLQALAPEVPPTLLRVDELRGTWPLAAHITLQPED